MVEIFHATGFILAHISFSLINVSVTTKNIIRKYINAESDFLYKLSTLFLTQSYSCLYLDRRTVFRCFHCRLAKILANHFYLSVLVATYMLT